LRALGYFDGQNIVVEPRYGEANVDLLAEHAAELVRQPVDIIVTMGGSAVLVAAKNATQTIPIVMVANTADPIALGVIASYAHPGGNVTGLATFPQGKYSGKQLEFLQEVSPGLTRVVGLWDRTASVASPLSTDAQVDARSLG